MKNCEHRRNKEKETAGPVWKLTISGCYILYWSQPWVWAINFALLCNATGWTKPLRGANLGRPSTHCSLDHLIANELGRLNHKPTASCQSFLYPRTGKMPASQQTKWCTLCSVSSMFNPYSVICGVLPKRSKLRHIFSPNDQRRAISECFLLASSV